MAAGVNYERILNARWSRRTGSPTTAPTTGSGTARWTRSTRTTSSASARVGLPGRLDRPARGRVDVRVRGRPDRRRRGHVRLRLGRLGLGPRRARRATSSGDTSTRPLRRVAVLRQREPRGRRGRGEGLHRHRERPRARARRHHRQEGLGHRPTATCGPARAPRSRRWS